MRLKSIIKKITKKISIYNYYLYIQGGKKYGNKFYAYSNEKKVFLLLLPTYGNIGDQAIAVATLNYLKDYFSEYKLITIDLEDTYKYMKAIEKSYNEHDLIFLQGGGNMGNLYPYIEEARQFAISHLKKAKIISMPTTISFTNDKRGVRALEKSKKIYEKNRNLILIAREEESYRLMNSIYPNSRILLTPDIVFYLSDKNKKHECHRDKIIVCLRRDIESNLTIVERNQLLLDLLKEYPNIFLFDTTVTRDIPAELRGIEVDSILNEFMRARVIITDRMHGMIFSAITKTPCIVFKSRDHKVNGTFNWLKELDYIELVESKAWSDLKPILKRMTNSEMVTNDLSFKEYYTNLRDELLK